jgi:hypothetical protein
MIKQDNSQSHRRKQKENGVDVASINDRWSSTDLKVEHFLVTITTCIILQVEH